MLNYCIVARKLAVSKLLSVDRYLINYLLSSCFIAGISLCCLALRCLDLHLSLLVMMK